MDWMPRCCALHILVKCEYISFPSVRQPVSRSSCINFLVHAIQPRKQNTFIECKLSTSYSSLTSFVSRISLMQTTNLVLHACKHMWPCRPQQQPQPGSWQGAAQGGKCPRHIGQRLKERRTVAYIVSLIRHHEPHQPSCRVHKHAHSAWLHILMSGACKWSVW